MSTDNDWMNDQLRARAGTTVVRSDEAGEEIADALRAHRGHEPISPQGRARAAEPVGPEPQTQSVGEYRRWLYQHAANLDAAGRLPGERGYNPRTVGDRDSFELVAERVRRWRDVDRSAG
jgi:hypothetical protein